MKAHVQIVGDYDEQTGTLGIQLIAYEKDIIAAGIEDGKEVEVLLVSHNKTNATGKEHDTRQYQLSETLRMWDLFQEIAPLADQVKSECHSLISLWRAELESIEAVAKLQRKGADE